VRTHVCPFCGYLADRDENAARNILQRGLQVLARTGPSSSRREGPEQSGESPSAVKREAAGLSSKRRVTHSIVRQMERARFAKALLP
ncbi:MAG: zinc ribbon domain-containing protein, partial [Ktedonobacteraceae bacterium]